MINITHQQKQKQKQRKEKAFSKKFFFLTFLSI